MNSYDISHILSPLVGPIIWRLHSCAPIFWISVVLIFSATSFRVVVRLVAFFSSFVKSTMSSAYTRHSNVIHFLQGQSLVPFEWSGLFILFLHSLITFYRTQLNSEPTSFPDLRFYISCFRKFSHEINLWIGIWS